jgi:hypothetical protein
MDEVLDVVKRWKLDLGKVREQVYRAPTPRERERWHAVWLLAEGCSPQDLSPRASRAMLVR